MPLPSDTEERSISPVEFIHKHPARTLVLSVLLLVPCLWHRHIQAGDLGSHVYNAWLAQLAKQGRAPGIYLVWQWKNVLFDVILFQLANLFGFLAAEKIAVSLCVLIFFWGVFALATAASRQAPWFLSPCIAMLAYGYTFHMGFMNYYLSIGLGCLGLALLWEGKRSGIAAAALIAPLALLAHPLGFLWLVGAGAYRLLWTRLKSWTQLILPALALTVLLAARWYFKRHPIYEPDWSDFPFYHWNGTDQFQVFGERYFYLQLGIILLVLLAIGVELWRPAKSLGDWKIRRLLLEFYLICVCATALLPEDLRPTPQGSWIGGLVSRLTLFTAICAICWLGTLRPQKWHLAGFSLCAAFFFLFLYQDTAYLNRMEASAEKITQQLPFGTRVAATLFAPEGYRTIYLHLVDRACIGHCFLVSNYEPSTKEFRVRVREGSPVVAATVDDSEEMQSGTYDVQEEDLPLKQIYQCDATDLTRLCIRDLAPGEKNDRLGYHPVTNPFFLQNP